MSESTKWTERRTRAVRRAVDIHGLRVICCACDYEGRHFPRNGRIRDAKCDRCRATEVVSKAWARRYPMSFELKVRRAKLLANALHGTIDRLIAPM